MLSKCKLYNLKNAGGKLALSYPFFLSTTALANAETIYFNFNSVIKY